MRSVTEPDPITLRIRSRAGEPTTDPKVVNVDQARRANLDRREQFWADVRRAAPNMPATPTQQLESTLVREFGPALKRKLVAHLQEPLKATGWLSDADLLNRIPAPPYVDDFYRAKIYQEFSAFLEERKRQSADKTIRAAFEKLAAAALLIFVVRIEAYQSLSLSLLIGSIEKLGQVFDGDAFNLKLFLGAFAAEAFGEVFGLQAADQFVFDAVVPDSLASAMSARAVQAPADQAVVEAHRPTVRELAQQQARTAWRYATTTMLIPVLLALAVTYFAVEEMRATSALREKAVESTLEHQLQLLREDRLRMTPPRDSSARVGGVSSRNAR